MENYRKKSFAKVWVALSLLFSLLVDTATTWSQATAQELVKITLNEAPSDTLRVVLLGTAIGPSFKLRQYGASTLIEAGGKRLLFDCGRGATLRLTQLGVPIGTINKLFLTHLHSDHIIQIPDLYLAGWVGKGRKVPLEVWGPTGTSDMMNALSNAFSFDIHIRRDVDEKFSPEGIKVQSHDIGEGVLLNENGIKVTAFLVDHRPIVPAFGYRIDYRGRSVVLSGDTRVNENLIKFSRGVDVLIHEAIDAPATRKRIANKERAERVIAHHTTGEQAGKIFARVKPRLAVFSHAPDSQSLIEQTRKHYTGPLQGPEDLLTIDIENQITVRHFGEQHPIKIP